jgi:hypothetical protein
MTGVSVQELARELGLYTADQLEGSRSGAAWWGAIERFDDHDKARARWPREKKLLFEIVMPAAMTVVVSELISITTYHPDRSVKRRRGHNLGMRPVYFTQTSSWRDTATMTHNRAAAYEARAEIRIWAKTDSDRDRLVEAVIETVTDHAEATACERDLRRGWHDIGPHVELEAFARGIRNTADGLQIRTRDDRELSAWLDQVLVRVRKRSAELGERRVTMKTINQVLRELY